MDVIKKTIWTGCDEMTLKVSVSTAAEMLVWIVVIDSERPEITLTNRNIIVEKDFTFFVRMPLTRNKVDVLIFNEQQTSDGITLNEIKKLSLEKRLNVIDFDKYKLKDFIRFIQNFAYNAPYLRLSDINDPKDFYRSQGKNFFIKYLDVICDYDTGQPLTTPARIDQNSGLIELSKFYIKDYTVPEIAGTLLHEYSHPWANSDPNSEKEADLNGLIIYLGLGYPRIEAINVWTRILDDNPTEENMQRKDLIIQFINDFENQKIVFN